MICARIDGSKLAEQHCEDKTKPEHEQSCNTQQCRGVWVASEWSKVGEKLAEILHGSVQARRPKALNKIYN